MRAQSTRIKVIAENIANSDTTATTAGGNPYVRKSISFKDVLDRSTGENKVQIGKISQSAPKDYTTKYMPDNPGADATGYVKMPNVDPLIETMDMREAQRSYEANLGMIDQARSMYNETLDILKH